MYDPESRELIRELTDSLARAQKALVYEGVCTNKTDAKRQALIAKAREYLKG
jgi:hypothetical protein